MSKYQNVTVTREGHVGVVVMCSAPVNALTFDLLDDLSGAFHELEADKDVWAVVLCSGMRLFAAGADLKNLAVVRRSGNLETARHMQRVFLQIENFPHPVICAVNGVALGGGLELALSCDLRVFTAKTKVGFPEGGLGIIPGAGGTQRLSKLIGLGAAKRLIYTSETVRGEEAYRLGMCEYLADEDACLAKAMGVAATICTKAPLAVAADKKCINYSREHTLMDGLEYEQNLSGDIFETEDKSEGIASFLEKREANFQNK